jgi:hypothetical protein
MCQISINEFRGTRSVQLLVQDIRLSEKIDAAYKKDAEKYSEISGGAEFSHEDDILPTRADIVDVYKLLRKENMGGHTVFNYRAFRSTVSDSCHRSMNLAKIRFILDILGDIRVCRVEHTENDCFTFEVDRNAAKTNIELSETYRKLFAQCEN